MSHELIKPSPYEYKWALILMEKMTVANNDADQVLKVAQDLFMVDVLLGNWECVSGNSKEELASDSNAMYGTTGILSSVLNPQSGLLTIQVFLKFHFNNF